MDLKDARVITAMVTPFNEEGLIDDTKLESLIEFLLSNGSEGLVVGGTTGESPTLTHEEKLFLYEKTVEVVAGRVPIIAGTGSNNTAETISFTKEVEKLKGISAVLVVGPYYNKPNQAGFYAHFEAVAQNTELPIIIYNVPGRTSKAIEPETTIKLSKISNIIGVKECLGIDAISEIIENTTTDFLVYSGEDNLSFPAKCVGGSGVISIASHLFGKELSEMYDLLENDSIKEAAKLHRQLLPKMESLFIAPSPAPVKFGLSLIGIDAGSVRLPLVDCSEEEKKYLAKVLQLNKIKS